MVTGKQGRVRGFSIVHLRRWLLAVLLLLVAVLAGVLGYARYRARRLLSDLPHRLGIDIKSETNGFTYSQTVKGRTVFTVHAAKAIQRENGKTTLHDVAITLYGPPGSNRTDSIRGAEFEYDQPNGVIKGMGETHLDLALPGPAGAQPTPAKRAQITTSGVIFLQKLGVAATDQPIHLLYGDIRGDATGADFESDTGMLRLRNDVRLDGMQNGRAIHVDASAAEMDRGARTATLHNAHVMADKDRAAGDTVVLALRTDGSIEALNADGNASVESQSGVHAGAPHLHAVMTTVGKLDTAAMHGGVRMEAENGSGSAVDALLHFDAAGKPVSVQLRHAVEIHARQTVARSASTLTADAVDAQISQEGAKTVLRDAVASGNAMFRNVGEVRPSPAEHPGRPGPAVTRTGIIRASELRAGTALSGGKRYISVIDGTGGTRVEESDTAGNQRISTGDVLHAVLSAPGAGQRGSETGALQSAVQTGHVAVTQHTPATPRKAAQDSRATAARAEFDTTAQCLLLTGAPVVTAPGVQLAADRITLAQSSGDAEAGGNVKGTFRQESQNGKEADPVHVLADKAEIAGKSGLARFHGTERPARMWSSTGQLQAAEIDLDRSAGTLAAHMASASVPRQVHLILTPQRIGASSDSRRAEIAGPAEITGDALLMTSATANAPSHLDVTGAVRMVSGTTEVTSGELVATLRPAGKSNDTKQDRNPTVSAFNQGSIESITASDHVHLQQPGRVATGQRLFYTAADNRYQLTGTPLVPPRVNDSLRGNVTGAVLVFHGTDESVDVTGEQGKPVRTETEAKRPARSR